MVSDSTSMSVLDTDIIRVFFEYVVADANGTESPRVFCGTLADLPYNVSSTASPFAMHYITVNTQWAQDDQKADAFVILSPSAPTGQWKLRTVVYYADDYVNSFFVYKGDIVIRFSEKIKVNFFKLVRRNLTCAATLCISTNDKMGNILDPNWKKADQYVMMDKSTAGFPEAQAIWQTLV